MFTPCNSSGHNVAMPLFTVDQKGHARPNILILTARGLSVAPNCWKLTGKLELFLAFCCVSNAGSWKQG